MPPVALEDDIADHDADHALFVSLGISASLCERLRNRFGAHQPLPVFHNMPTPRRDAPVRRRAGLPGRRKSVAIRSVCHVVRSLSGEMILLVTGKAEQTRDRRFAVSHIQQIAMYVCHVALRLTMTDIAAAFGKDRTTVGYACARVEDRRDDRGYDSLVSSVERAVIAVFTPRMRVHG